jgi:hypothetical protein
MGARLGRWLSQLTQYSKAFMTQWSEEAMVIQDAVDEVRGIRDEIVAARAEIAGTLDTARQDIDATIGDARGTLNAARPNTQALLQQETTPQPTAAEAAERTETSETGTGEEAAIAKTQQILDDLMEKRPQPSASEANDEDVQQVESEDEAWQRNYEAIQEVMQEDVVREHAVKEEETEQAEPKATEPKADSQTQPDLPEHDQETDAEEMRESAFDKTQRILDDLMRKKSGVEQETLASVEDTQDQEEEQKRPTMPDSAVSEEERPLVTTPTTDTGMPRTGQQRPEQGVSYSKFAQLSIQVTLLKNEIKTLKDEIQALRTDLKPQMVATASTETKRSTEPTATNEPSTETTATALAVEEVT